MSDLCRRTEVQMARLDPVFTKARRPHAYPPGDVSVASRHALFKLGQGHCRDTVQHAQGSFWAVVPAQALSCANRMPQEPTWPIICTRSRHV